MTGEPEIINKVANSGIVTIDLELFYPAENIKELDIAPFLYEGLILREKEFRKSLEEMNWNDYSNTIIAVHCSADAIVPKWAYMLVAVHAKGIAAGVGYGHKNDVVQQRIIEKLIKNIDVSEYRDKRVIIKGCSDQEVNEAVYVWITQLLLPEVKSLMYGEPCSTVPLFKKK